MAETGISSVPDIRIIFLWVKMSEVTVFIVVGDIDVLVMKKAVADEKVMRLISRKC